MTSPNMLSESTVKKIIIDASKTIWGEVKRFPRSVAMIFPHEGVGGLIPTPKMASVPSATIAIAIPSNEMENMAGSTLCNYLDLYQGK